MRKLSFMFLLWMYLLPAAGMSVQAHYCGEELESISLFGLGDLGCCCDDEAGDPADCCGEKLAVFHFEDAQQFSHQLRIPSQQLVALIPSLPSLEAMKPADWRKSNSFRFTDEPPDHAPPLFLRFSRLLI